MKTKNRLEGNRLFPAGNTWKGYAVRACVLPRYCVLLAAAARLTTAAALLLAAEGQTVAVGAGGQAETQQVPVVVLHARV